MKRAITALLIAVAALSLAGCDDPPTRASTSKQQETESTYQSAAPQQGPSLHSYDCTQDCSGHDAGYQWAEENGITDPDECDGNSESFIEGCQAYAEEQSDENEETEE
jgi:hypothetical protein